MPRDVRAVRWTLALVGGLLFTSASDAIAQGLPAGTSTQRVASGLNAPLFATSPAGDNNRLFIVEQGSGGSANIKILNLSTGVVNPTPFLTVTGLATGGEQGLLGLAFHPDFATNGRLFVNVTAPGGSFGQGITQIREYNVSGTPLTNPTANATPVQTLYSFDQPQTNHNGGWIGFSPRAGDAGNLYIAAGDGGNGNDQGTGHTEPTGNAQNPQTPLGKILRINVNGDDFPGDATRNYALPASTPFNGTNGLREIFATGVRNPFRDSFDRSTGNLYMGDVGQSNREEIDFQSASNTTGGENYQWRLREGDIATPTGSPVVGGAAPPGSTGPIDTYDRSVGSTVTGGYVYRGNDIAGLGGAYLFGDFGSARLFLLRYNGTAITTARTDITAALAPGGGLSIGHPSSFGEDGRGEMYIVDYGNVDGNGNPIAGTGEVYRIVPEPGALAAGSIIAMSALLRRRRRF